MCEFALTLKIIAAVMQHTSKESTKYGLDQ